MSHYSYIKIRIKNPNIQLLKRTVEEIAKEINARIVSEIKDYYGYTRSDFLIGLKNNDFFRGIGVKINSSGEVELVGDLYQVSNHAIKDLQKKIVQHYTKNAMLVSMKKMGYSQFQVNKAQEKIYIRAMGW